MLPKNFAISTLTLCATILSSEAAIPFVIRTNASGQFIGQTGANGELSPAASYTDTGTIPGVVQAGVSTSGSPDSDLLINDLQSGTLNIADLRKFDDSGLNGGAAAGNRISGDIGVAIDISFIGGTGDLRINNTTSSTAGAKTHPTAASDSGIEEYTSFGITDIDGVTSITFKLTFNQPLATRVVGAPFGSAMGLLVADGVDNTRINTTMSFGGIVSDPNNDGVFTPGIDPNSVASSFGDNWDNFTSNNSNIAGISTFTMNNGLSPLITHTAETISGDPQSVVNTGTTGFNLIRGFDSNGGGFSSTDAPLTYITEQTWTITLDGSDTFNENTNFIFSLDGAQHTNLTAAAAAIPEPSTALLSLLGLSSFILRRNRRNKGNL